MKCKILISIFVLSLLLLTVSSIAVRATVPMSPQTPLGASFTYQGQLRGGNAPGTGNCDMAFRLFDAVSAGNQIGSPITQTVPITNNLFTVNLDFGAAPFTGEARWLEVGVKCGSDPNFSTLSPRQALTATPYAISLLPNATVNGLNNLGNLSFGATTRQMLNLWGTGYGIGVQNATLYFRTNTTADGFAWYAGGEHSDIAHNAGPLGSTFMLLDGHGLTVTNHIAVAANSSNSSSAFLATNQGNGPAIYGGSNSNTAIQGESSTGDGVIGVTGGISNSAVLGSNTAGGVGVTGVTTQCNNFPCSAIGVHGKSVTPGNSGGVGVFGEGDQMGVNGESLLGIGVRGGSSATSGVEGFSVSANGVEGVSTSAAASGVYGENLSGGYGVAGRANGGNPAVLGDHTGTGGIGVSGHAVGLNSKGVYGEVTNCAAGLNCYAIYADGNFAVAPGWTKSAIVHTADYGDRHLYAMESPENWFEDFGLGQLVNGQAVIQIDPVFAQTVNLTEDYHVFLTPRDGFAELYVANLTATSFEVHDAKGKTALAFSYRIIAKREGFETMRLTPSGQ